MTELAIRRPGRPPKTSREQILDAAAVFEPSELQLTTLAQQLGISVKTVYYYFPNRRALLDALTERTVEERGLVDLSRCRTPREVLEQVGSWAYGVGRTQPGWLFQSTAPHGAAVRVMTAYLRRMSALGVPDDDALVAFSVVGNYALATGERAYRTENLGGLSAANVHAHLDDFADAATVERITSAMADTELDAWFDRGLSAVLTGVEREILSRR